MPFIRRWSVVLLSFLVAVVHAQDATRTLSVAEAKGFRVTGYSYVKFEEAREDIVRSFKIDFFNDTREEIQSVDVRFRVTEGGKTTFLSRAFRIDRFHDYPFAREGSALPRHRAPATFAISVQYPGQFWNTASRDTFEVVAVHAFVGKDDLHDIGHLYAWLARSSGEEIARTLRSNPSLAKVSDPGGATALAVACNVASVPAIEAIIAAGAPYGPIAHIGGWNVPLSHLAAANDDPGPLAYLKEKGIPIDAPNTAGHTALDVALDTGRFANARWLLANGADPNRRDKEGNPPAFYAYNAPNLSGIEMLAKAGADLKYHNKGVGLMHLAALTRTWDTALLERLVATGVGVDDADPRQKVTPLMEAAYAQNHLAARWLFAHGARLEARDALGRDAFDYARKSNTLNSDRFFRADVGDKTAGRGGR